VDALVAAARDASVRDERVPEAIAEVPRCRFVTPLHNVRALGGARFVRLHGRHGFA
jgi:protein-L-isoaspartate O-methyltransferase